MHNRYARAFTAIGLVFTLWAGSLAAVAPLPRQQQTDAQKQQSQQKDVAANKKADDKTAQPSATPSNPGKPLSEKEDPRLIGKRKINGGFIASISGGVDKEVAIGRQLSAEVHRAGQVHKRPVITEYINRVGQNIVLHSDAKIPFTIKVIDSDEVNAFALPGGFFYVNKGLILAAATPATRP